MTTEFVNKPGLGTMRANKYKDSENKPDIKGELTLNDGQVVKFAGWKKTDRNGGTYYSLKQDKPREGGADDAFHSGGSGRVADSGRDAAFDLDDTIPFVTRQSIW